MDNTKITEVKIAFISGRYTGKNRQDVELNIQAAKHVARIVTEKGYFAFCPHMNSAHFDDYIKMPHEFWYVGDLQILVKACNILVCVPGFSNSSGAMKEIETAKKHGIPIYYLVDDVPVVNNA